MDSDVQTVALAKSQAACLAALRTGKSTLTPIALTARVSVKTATVALSALQLRGLAERSDGRRWRTTQLGDSCVVRVETRKASLERLGELSRNGRRLLEMLERPIEGRTIAKKLGLSRQGALNVMRRLHAQGHLKFGDPENPSWWVMRADDKTHLLAREQERVFSAIPGEYATNAAKIEQRTHLSADRIEAALAVLVGAGLVEAAGEFNGAALFRSTAAGLAHPQNRPHLRDAEPPRLPVYSNRIRGFLSAIEDAGALRIKDLSQVLQWDTQATNSLMQYLKRRGLVQKSDDLFDAPYLLTKLGRLTLAELIEPRRMRSGYAPEAVQVVQRPGGSSLRVGGISAPRRPKKVKAEKPPRLPVHSDRIKSVLSVISDAGALRIKDISDLLSLPLQSINSLLQYLKRKGLVQKTDERIGAPFVLTESGRATLTEMQQRRAA